MNTKRKATAAVLFILMLTVVSVGVVVVAATETVTDPIRIEPRASNHIILRRFHQAPDWKSVSRNPTTYRSLMPPPQPLHEDVVQVPTLTIHADLTLCSCNVWVKASLVN